MSILPSAQAILLSKLLHHWAQPAEIIATPSQTIETPARLIFLNVAEGALRRVAEVLRHEHVIFFEAVQGSLLRSFQTLPIWDVSHINPDILLLFYFSVNKSLITSMLNVTIYF